jgi:predicted GNAT family acetyltransferase
VSEVVDNASQQRFEVTVDGYTGYLAYERTATTLTLVHTEVPPEIRGRHLGDELVDAGVAAARAAGLQLIVVCRFARDYMRRHATDQRATERSKMPDDRSRHPHTPEQERRIREAALDETIAASFPASDPPSTDPNPDDEDALEPGDAERTD